jgi:hypothetical protein
MDVVVMTVTYPPGDILLTHEHPERRMRMF